MYLLSYISLCSIRADLLFWFFSVFYVVCGYVLLFLLDIKLVGWLVVLGLTAL